MRWLLVILLICTSFAPAASAAGAEAILSQPASAPFTQRRAGIMDYVANSRSRMIQVATIAFGIGLVILMTSTRKH